MTKFLLEKVSIFIILIVISCLLSSQTFDFLWTNQIGGDLDDEGTSLTIDHLNNYYTTGWFNESAMVGDVLLTGNGGNDIIMTKYDENGELIWAKTIGGTGSDKGHGINTDGSNFIYLTGEFSEEVFFDSMTSLTSYGSKDIFIAKYDLEGDLIWARSAGGTSFDSAYDIKIDSQENVVITGRFNGSALFEETTITGNGSWDIFLAKYNSNGNLIWIRSAGGTGFDYGKKLDIDHEDNISLTGYFFYSAEFGSIIVNSYGDCDIFIAKYDADGTPQWVRGAGGNQFDQGLGICCDEFGNNYVIGFFESTAHFGELQLESNGYWDFFIAKYNSEGTVIWIQKAGSIDGEQGRDIKLDNNGDLVITGFFHYETTFGDITLTSTGLADVFIANLDVDGQFNWARKAGGTEDELANSIVVDHNNYTLVTGKFNDYTVFDSDSLNTSGTGDNDIFFAKLDAGDINEIYHEYLESSEIENLACYPNPFLVDQDLMIEINFNLKQNRYVQINVYNIIGQKVRALMDQKLNNGYHTHFWDGKNENGLSVKSGVYFCGIKIGGRFVTKKLIVL